VNNDLLLARLHIV